MPWRSLKIQNYSWSASKKACSVVWVSWFYARAHNPIGIEHTGTHTYTGPSFVPVEISFNLLIKEFSKPSLHIAAEAWAPLIFFFFLIFESKIGSYRQLIIIIIFGFIPLAHQLQLCIYRLFPWLLFCTVCCLVASKPSYAAGIFFVEQCRKILLQ